MTVAWPSLEWARVLLIPLLIMSLPTSTAASEDHSPAPRSTLIARAVLPARTFSPGPTTGAFIGPKPIHGVAVPFHDRVPVGGFSSLVWEPGGTLLGLVDNGFGSIANSADFPLRLYRLKPRWKTAKGGEGVVDIESFISLSDPDGLIPFCITHQWRSDRQLTGSDIDVESLQVAPDGSLWVGDEFGPFLLRFSKTGKLLEPPHELPGTTKGTVLRSRESPFTPRGSVLRMMNAARAHARANGGSQTPVCAPNSSLVKSFDPDLLTSAGFPLVAWTVNDRKGLDALLDLRVRGIISDRPDLLREAVLARRDKHPEWFNSSGLLNASLFDAQGHRGGRHLRPENTLPAMEVALDELMSTLETDGAITADGVPVLRHDAAIEALCARRVDGVPYLSSKQSLIKDLTLQVIQRDFIADRLLPGLSEQRNDLQLSPVTVAFAKSAGLAHPYVIPSLDQLFEFVPFYEAYYREGPGRAHPDAARRAANAAQARFNIETKIDPTRPGDTVSPEAFVDAIASRIERHRLKDRAELQSFDFRTLKDSATRYSWLRGVYLMAPTTLTSKGARPWLAGLPWTAQNQKPRVGTSAGIEGMALSADGKRLLPMLEKPLLDGSGEQPILEFDLASNTFTTTRWSYKLDPRATSIGEFEMTDDRHGVVIERDDSQGTLRGFKALFAVELEPTGGVVKKELVADLLSIDDPNNVSTAKEGIAVGLGRRFALPFQTIESVVVLDARHVLLACDNNFPFSVGRQINPPAPDDSEFVVIELSRPLPGHSPTRDWQAR